MTQRIFQNMLRMRIPLESLNNAVKKTTTLLNKYQLVSQIKDYSGCEIKFGSDFWQFLFNQIYIMTEAEQTNAL